MGDYRTTMGEEHPVSGKEQRRRRKAARWWFTLAGLLLLLGGSLIKVERYVPATGYVTTADYAEVRPASQGPVAEILVGTGTQVEQGQALARLEDAVPRAQLAEARAQVRRAEAERARRAADIAERQRHLTEQIATAEWRLEHAATRLRRTRELLARGLVADSLEADHALEERLAQAQLETLRATDPQLFEGELAVLDLEIEARREEEAAALARLELHWIRAPLAGQVLRYEFYVGELVRPENVLYEIFSGPLCVLKLRVAERHALRVSTGQRYRARLTAFRGLRPVYFRGQVASVRNVIQTQGELGYRVAYCDFDPGARPAPPPGATAEARIYYGRANIWVYLLGLD